MNALNQAIVNDIKQVAEAWGRPELSRSEYVQRGKVLALSDLRWRPYLGGMLPSCRRCHAEEGAGTG